MSQKREDFLTCMAGALRFYGGVPKAIVSDNLKSAVTRSGMSILVVTIIYRPCYIFELWERSMIMTLR
jgi:transposase